MGFKELPDSLPAEYLAVHYRITKGALLVNSFMNIFPLKTSQTTAWLVSDSLDLFQQNIARLPQTWLHRASIINYAINSTGHRSPEWTEVDWTRYMLAIGDSTTMGIGLDQAQLWSTQLAESLSLQAVNCSEPTLTHGDIVNRVTELMLRAPSLPRLIVIQWPALTCESYTYQGETLRLGGQEPQTDAERYWWINYQRSQAERSDVIARFTQSRRYIECLCQRANIALWQFTLDDGVATACPDLAQPRVYHPDTEKTLAARLEFLARDVEVSKTTKAERAKGWGDLRPRAHPGLYYQQRVIDLYWAAGVELKY
jgi:hypothetical protein